MKKPMTTEELFNKIYKILKEKGKLPDILDYGLAAYGPAPITNYEFGLKSNLNYGGSEGIYSDLWIEYCGSGQKRQGSWLILPVTASTAKLSALVQQPEVP